MSLYDLATSEIFGLAPADVTLALNRARRRRSPLAVALREAAEHPEESPFTLRALEVVQRLLGSLDAHRAMSTERSCGELLYHFITSTGWLGRLAHEARETGEERLANVGRFFEIVRRQGSLLRDDRLPFLVEQLDTLIETGDDPSTADVDAGPGDGDAVHVLTYHKAKGLEFDVVFLVGLVADRFPGRDRRDPLEMPDELVRDELTVSADHHVSEERRLFYVGMTRARDELHLSWAQDYGGRRSRSISQFVTEALDLPPATPADVVQPLADGAARPARRIATRRGRGPTAARGRRQAPDAELRPDPRLPRMPGAISVRPPRPHPDARLAPDGLRPRPPRGGAGVPSAPDGRPVDDPRRAPRRPRRRAGSRSAS